MRYWRVWVPALVAVMMVVAFVPGREFDYSRGYFNRPRKHAEAVRSAEWRLEQRIARIEAQERLLAAAQRRPAVVRGSLRVVYTGQVSRSHAEAWADALLADIAAVTHVTAPRGEVVVYLTGWDSVHALQKGSYRQWGSFGVSEPCLAFAEAGDDRLAAVRAGESPMILGGCSFVLAFGAHGRAARAGGPYAGFGDRLFGGQPADVAGERRALTYNFWDRTGPAARDCIDGNDATCLALADESNLGLAYWILREHGAEGLERFWRGGPTIGDALSSATSLTGAQAARAWVNDQYDVSRLRTRATPDHATRAGLTMGLGLVLSLLVARRRRIV